MAAARRVAEEVRPADTEARSFTSKLTGREFRSSIALPRV
jgi:hypothetical protein